MMHVGAAVVELHVHGSHSLKAKRGVVNAVVGRIRSRFNVAVAEVGGQDTWQRCVIGVTTVSSDPEKARKVLRRIIDFIEETHLAELVAEDIEIMAMPLAGDEDDLDEGLEREADHGCGDEA